MKKQIIAIGGGGFGRNPGKGVIEQYIINQTKKKKPKICFIPTATGDDESYKVSFYQTFTKLSCTPTHLDFFKRTPDIENLILKQDIIFVGGGNTKSMLAVWRDWRLDKVLKKAYQRGIVMTGVSAGAICWFNKGITDSWADELKIINCLSFTKGACCPHYDEEKDRRPSLKEYITKGKIKSCFAIEGNCALHLIDDKVFRAISFGNGKNSYEVRLRNNSFEESKIKNLQI